MESLKLEMETTTGEEEEETAGTLNATSTKEIDFLNELTEATTSIQVTSTTTTLVESTSSSEAINESEMQSSSAMPEQFATFASSTHQFLSVTENGNLTTTEIHIDLPIYLPNSSETPESFLKFYTSEMHTVVVDDEATDKTVRDDLKHMSADDFVSLTEFPLTILGSNQTHTSSEVETTTPNVPHAGCPSVTQKAKTTTYEKPVDAGLLVPEDLKDNFNPNGCSASDFQSGSGCFCVIDEMLSRLNHALHDKDLAKKVDAFKCESFFKVKEGILINNKTLESRVKRSYLFLKHQQEMEVFKREIVPHNEIESVLKATSHIHNSGKGCWGRD